MKFKALFAVLLTALFAGCSDEPTKDSSKAQKYIEPQGIEVHAVCSLLCEKPNALSVSLLGDGAIALQGCFERASLKVFTNDVVSSKSADIVVFSSAANNTPSFSDATLLAMMVDVRGIKMGELKEILESFPCPEETSHIWMLGEFKWLVVGSKQPVNVDVSSILEVFTREELFEDIALARLNSAPMIFANYAGTLKSALEAFLPEGLENEAFAEFFITRDIPEITWLETTNLDEDVAKAVLTEIRSAQVVRRLVIEGAMMGRSGKEAEAINMWARAALRNPGDLYLAGRVGVLESNARAFLKLGNIKGAAKCFEMLILINPADEANMFNYATAMQRIGETNVAAHAFERVEKLRRAKEK